MSRGKGFKKVSIGTRQNLWFRTLRSLSSPGGHGLTRTPACAGLARKSSGESTAAAAAAAPHRSASHGDGNRGRRAAAPPCRSRSSGGRLVARRKDQGGRRNGPSGSSEPLQLREHITG